MARRQEAERRGRRSETLAAWWLRLHGWQILARRVRTPVGEIDIVARRRHVLAFVEVKARRTAAEADIAIDRPRLRRVAAAATLLADRFTRPGDAIRIDVMLLSRDRLPRHLTNVWHG